MLKEFRKKKGITQSQAAEFLGWTTQYYARFEKDQLIPTEYNYKKFSSLLNVSITEFKKMMQKFEKE